MAALINELTAIPEELNFVLDDYCVIDSDLARQRSGWTRRAASSTAGGSSALFGTGSCLCTLRGLGCAGLAEDVEQRLAGTAQAVVDPLAAAVRLDQLCGLEPREVRGDCGGAKA